MDLFQPLRHSAYRRLFLAQVMALAGTGLATIAMALLAHDLAGADAGAVLGTALALKMVAYVGIAPVVGGFGHRLPRKAVLIALDLIRAALAVSLLFVDAVWQLYCLIFLINACSAGFTPLFQATIPDILPDEQDYTRALSLSRLAYDLEHILSPALAGLALLMLSFDALFAANALGFLASAGLVTFAAVPKPAPVERERGVWSNLTFGVRAYLKTPRTRGLLALYVAVTAGGAMVIVNTVVYVRTELGLGESALAGALFAAGAGSMLVALTLPRLLATWSDRSVMLAGSGLTALALALAATLPGYGGLVALWFALGTGGALIQTPAARVIRRSCREADRGAFFAANFALQHLAWLFGYLAAGYLWPALGGGPAFLIMASMAVAATTVAAMAWTAQDPAERIHEHAPIRHGHLHWHDEHHQHAHDGWEGPEPHSHPHHHTPVRHRHAFVIDQHHPDWPG